VLPRTDPLKFELITRRRGHDRVLSSVNLALELGIPSVKINSVIMRNLNHTEILDFVAMTEKMDVEIRFIEYMPFDGNSWNDKKFFAYAEMLSLIKAKYGEAFQPLKGHPNDTSKTWQVEGFKGRVGFITSMSEHFCFSCNRLRLTADGNLKVCLFGATEVSLRDAIRSGMSPAQLSDVISSAVKRKKPRHAGMFEIARNSAQNRPMITIGG